MNKATMGGLFVLMGALSFAAEPILIKFAYETGLSPLSVTLARLLVAIAIMAPVFLSHIRHHRLSMETWIVLIIGGAIGHSGVMILIALALQRISASVTILCLYLYPTVTTLIAAPILGEKITVYKVVALAGSLTGVGLVAWAPAGAIDPLGVAFAVAAALVNGFLIVAVKRWLGDLPPLVSSAGVLCFSTLAYAAVALLSPISLALPAQSVPYILGLGLVSTVAALALLYEGLSMIEASAASIIATSEPAMTAVLAALFLGETLTGRQFLGGALIIGCTVLASLYESHRQQPVE